MSPPSCALALSLYLISVVATEFVQGDPSKQIVLKLADTQRIELEPYDQVEFIVNNIQPSVAYTLLQLHTQKVAVNVSLAPQWIQGYSTTGTSVGIVHHLDQNVSTSRFYANVTCNETAVAVVRVDSHSQNDPVPGDCNMEFELVTEPSTLVTTAGSLNHVQFAYGNIGRGRDVHEPNCESSRYQTELEYDLYMKFLHSRELSEEYFLDTLSDLLTEDDLKANATKVATFVYDKDQTRRDFAAYPRQGVVYSVVVRQTSDSGIVTTAAYVPAITYACNFDEQLGDYCYQNESIFLKVLTYVFGVLGLLLCFCGHRYFKCEMFAFGFLSWCLVAYILIARFSTVGLTVQLVVVLVAGVLGGALWCGCWCLTGIPVLAVLLVGIVMGFLFSSIIFNFAPLAEVYIFKSDFSYGMCFACGVLIVPVFLLCFARTLSILSCAFVGSYFVVVAADFHLTSSVTYFMWNTLRKCTITHYIDASSLVPLRINDIVLISIWAVLTVAGFAFQTVRERGKPEFPPCPYNLYKLKQSAQMSGVVHGVNEGDEDVVNDRRPLLPERFPRPYRDDPIVQPL